MNKVICYGADGTDSRIKLHVTGNDSSIAVFDTFLPAYLNEVDCFIRELIAAREDMAEIHGLKEIEPHWSEFVLPVKEGE